ncbi:hypothetical protein FEF22_001465 [Texas Phoenix palm phytoplasma]|uniref:Uncharacterized protein n=1 Tax=Texas Phoenix palm phytoplasma TaxID=176709 RepID=A0ABS5BIQ0_9MOLU|nr:hypothetical protein [Texas Phoenix palm phytoplasma]MBP3059452.1 hypothetical protein [Texas Phoenix palm phytoplasma]
MSDLIKKFKKLTMLNAVPGQESSVRNFIKENIEKTVDKIEYDNLGSINVFKGNKGPKIMLASHMDEIGA